MVISSSGIPLSVPNGGAGLTVKNAKKVAIDGVLDDADTPIISVPVTFENRKEVTITKYGEGAIVGEDLVTTDTPVILKLYDYGSTHIVVPGSGIWAYRENWFGSDNFSDLNERTCYKRGEGWAYYEPPTAEGGAATLTLENVTYTNDINCGTRETRIVAKGSNRIEFIESEGLVTVDQTGGKLNAIVTIIEGDTEASTVYGDVVLADEDLDVDEEKTLTIPSGTSLTINEDSALKIEKIANLTIGEGAKIINDGEVKLRTDSDDFGDIPTYIKSLNLTGGGNVVVQKRNADTGVYEDVATYTNSGLKQLDPAGELDLSSADSDTSNWDTQGYKWENVEKDADDNITSGTLTLAEGFNATKVTLPDAAVTIVATGESRIGTLTPPGGDSAHANKTNLTFSGAGPLTVEERINVAGGDNNSITVAQKANVIAKGGIYVGASGGANSTVTVNGTLTIAPGSGTAISAGRVAIGSTGVLDISGAEGVQLNGMSKSGADQYKDLFTVTGDGRFTANCSDYNIRVIYINAGDLPKDENGAPDAKAVIRLGPEYMPDDCEPRVNDNPKVIDLIRISNDEVYNGPLTIHKSHIWSDRWTDGGDTHHHICTFEGCTAKKDESPHYYTHGSTACRDCGHKRPAGVPDSDGGGSSGGGSGGNGGGSSSSSGLSIYPVTVEKASRGKVSSNRTRASKGSTVTLTVTPDSGYVLEALTVTDSRGNDVKLTEKGGGKYTFTMPDRAVTIRAEFSRIAGGYEDCPQDSTCPIWSFPDADTTAWYHDGVHYCLDNGLVNGFGDGTFSPGKPITRAQLVQILHNREGLPSVNYRMQFEDVPGSAWYAEAVRWAASEGIVSGYSSDRFGPDDNITRAQLAVMLWRYAGSPAAEGGLEFTDADAVSHYALDALRWVVENGVMSGYGNGQLAPQGLATRAQAAQMLKNYLER